MQQYLCINEFLEEFVFENQCSDECMEKQMMYVPMRAIDASKGNGGFFTSHVPGIFFAVIFIPTILAQDHINRIETHIFNFF